LISSESFGHSKSASTGTRVVRMDVYQILMQDGRLIQQIFSEIAPYRP